MEDLPAPAPHQAATPHSSSQPLRSGELLLDGETRAGVVTSSLALRNDSFAGLALIRRQYLSSEQLSGPGGEVLTLD